MSKDADELGLVKPYQIEAVLVEVADCLRDVLNNEGAEPGEVLKAFSRRLSERAAELSGGSRLPAERQGGALFFDPQGQMNGEPTALPVTMYRSEQRLPHYSELYERLLVLFQDYQVNQVDMMAVLALMVKVEKHIVELQEIRKKYIAKLQKHD